MTHLLVINDKPIRIGNEEQLEYYKAFYPIAYKDARIVPVNEQKRHCDYYYCDSGSKAGYPLFIFRDNCEKTIYDLPIQTLKSNQIQIQLL